MCLTIGRSALAVPTNYIWKEVVLRKTFRSIFGTRRCAHAHFTPHNRPLMEKQEDKKKDTFLQDRPLSHVCPMRPNRAVLKGGGGGEDLRNANRNEPHGDGLCFLVMGPSLLQRLAVDGWRLAAVGSGCRLAVGGGWRLVVLGDCP